MLVSARRYWSNSHAGGKRSTCASRVSVVRAISFGQELGSGDTACSLSSASADSVGESPVILSEPNGKRHRVSREYPPSIEAEIAIMNDGPFTEARIAEDPA